MCIVLSPLKTSVRVHGSRRVTANVDANREEARLRLEAELSPHRLAYL